MGNRASRRTSDASPCKVILLDGSVATFDGDSSVAELMLEHPQQFVVELQPLLAGNMPKLLPAEQKLEKGMVYVMLPMKPGKAPTLSPAEVRQVLSRSRSLLRSRSFPCFSSSYSSSSKSGPSAKWGRPEAGGFDMRGGDAHEEKVKPAGKMGVSELSSSQGFGEMPEYLRRQLSGRLWRPSLHTIEERAAQKKMPHWLF